MSIFGVRRGRAGRLAPRSFNSGTRIAYRGRTFLEVTSVIGISSRGRHPRRIRNAAHSLGVTDPYDPVQNVRAGAAYLRTLLDRFGDLKSAIAAYNAGPGAVSRYGGVPPFAETRVYVERVMDAYRANLRR